MDDGIHWQRFFPLARTWSWNWHVPPVSAHLPCIPGQSVLYFFVLNIFGMTSQQESILAMYLHGDLFRFCVFPLPSICADNNATMMMVTRRIVSVFVIFYFALQETKWMRNYNINAVVSLLKWCFTPLLNMFQLHRGTRSNTLVYWSVYSDTGPAVTMLSSQPLAPQYERNHCYSL